MTVIKIMTLLVIGFNPSVLSTDNLRNLFCNIYKRNYSNWNFSDSQSFVLIRTLKFFGLNA